MEGVNGRCEWKVARHYHLPPRLQLVHHRVIVHDVGEVLAAAEIEVAQCGERAVPALEFGKRSGRRSCRVESGEGQESEREREERGAGRRGQ